MTDFSGEKVGLPPDPFVGGVVQPWLGVLQPLVLPIPITSTFSFSFFGQLQLTQAVAVAENVIRLLFTLPPYVSTIGDVNDGAQISHYSVSPVAGTVGFDGLPARHVSVLSAALSTDTSGNIVPMGIDVVVDRPMSPYPAQYTITTNNLADSTLSTILTPNPVSSTVFGLLKTIQPPRVDLAVPNRDFSNPQTAGSIDASTIGIDTSFGAKAAGGGLPTLGSFVADSSGDYAIEGGLSAIKKRILRRGLASPGAFLHLGSGYGVGLMDAVKQLGGAAKRDALAAEYERQIRQEPEVVQASVTAFTDPIAPAIVHFSIRVKTNTGASIQFDHNFNVVAGTLVSAG